MKKVFLFLLLIPLFLSGCTNSTEMEDPQVTIFKEKLTATNWEFKQNGIDTTFFYNFEPDGNFTAIIDGSNTRSGIYKIDQVIDNGTKGWVSFINPETNEVLFQEYFTFNGDLLNESESASPEEKGINFYPVPKDN